MCHESPLQSFTAAQHGWDFKNRRLTARCGNVEPGVNITNAELLGLDCSTLWPQLIQQAFERFHAGNADPPPERFGFRASKKETPPTSTASRGSVVSTATPPHHPL